MAEPTPEPTSENRSKKGPSHGDAGPLFRALTRFFDAIDDGLSRIGNGIRDWWSGFRDGPLRTFIVALVIGITGLVVLVSGLYKRLDAAVAWVEKTIVAVALLAMVGLIFNDYLVRESPIGLDIPGGPNMALVLMVWVGFFGASLATRRRQHLAVDATDRILSPRSAALAQRFSAFVAAGLCWTLFQGSWALMAESAMFEDSVEGLKVWSWLLTPLNALISVLPSGPEPGTSWPILTADAGFPLWFAQGVLPLSFLLMAFRFLFIGLFNVEPPPTDDEDAPAIVKPPVMASSRTGRDMVVAALFPGLLLGMAAPLYFGEGALIFTAAVLLFLIGAPLFVAIGVGALSCAVLIGQYDSVSVVTDMFEATKKHELLAIPFFVLAGNIMTQGTIAERLIGFARAVMGKTPGGLGLATVFACVIFAAISGSSPVTVIAIGTIMFPMLVRERYPERYSLGVLSTAGSLGIIIPPSVPMIVYAIVVSTPQRPISPSDLFLAGVLPGLFMAGVLAFYTLYRTRNVPLPKATRDGAYLKEVASAGRKGVLSLLLPLLILGGIYGWLSVDTANGPIGIKFTVTEAAAVAVVYALAIELFVHRELKLKKLPAILVDSSAMMGTLFLILVLAIAFNKFLTLEQVPQTAADWIAARVSSKLTFIILVNLFLLLLGTIMDILSAILIVAPLMAPIAERFGIDPVHFAIIFIVNLEIGYLTPPMGINLFVASTVFKRSLVEVVKSILPFLLLMLFCLAVISWVPGLSLWLLE